MLDQLWFSMRIMKTTLLLSIPVADSLDAAAKIKNKAKVETKRIFILSFLLYETCARRGKSETAGAA